MIVFTFALSTTSSNNVYYFGIIILFHYLIVSDYFYITIGSFCTCTTKSNKVKSTTVQQVK